MTIVSTSKKIIFIKPYLVNAKRVEAHLERYCDSPDDIIASMHRFQRPAYEPSLNKEVLEMAQPEGYAQYTLSERYENPWYCYVHLPLNILFPRIDEFYNLRGIENVSQEYYKISAIKDPFILAIDMFWYHTLYYNRLFDEDGINHETLHSIKHQKLKPSYKNIAHYYVKGRDNYDIIPWFNNWITSGILESKGVDNYEYLNERFYYDDDTKKENKIDFFIRCESFNEDLEKLCNDLEIPAFTVKQHGPRPFNHPQITALKVSDYYTQESREYMEKTFAFSCDIGGYSWEATTAPSKSSVDGRLYVES